MKSIEKINLNSENLIKERVSTGKITWKWPILIVFSRLVFAVSTQILVALLFFRCSPTPLKAAGDWWSVYGTLIDLGSLMLLITLLKEENLRFRDLLNFKPNRLWQDVLNGLGYILWVFPLAMAGITVCSLLIFGNPQPPTLYHPLPLWAAFYSLLIFPVFWGVMEQSTYQGYALPRLKALFTRPGFSILIVAIGWGIQHIALPLILDWRYMLFRFLSFLPLATVMAFIYLRKRRLIPFIIAHWAINFLGILSGIVVPMITK